MPTIKISDEPKPCFSPDHNPPMHMVFSPGTYEHTCPACGYKIRFVVQGFYCSSQNQQVKYIKQYENVIDTFDDFFPHHKHHIWW